MTQSEFAEMGEQEMKRLARENSKEIVIRSYHNGNSSDDRREATPEESEILYRLLYAAMLAYGWRSNGGSIDSILDTVEFACGQFLPEANAYDSVYIPLRKITQTW